MKKSLLIIICLFMFPLTIMAKTYSYSIKRDGEIVASNLTYTQVSNSSLQPNDTIIFDELVNEQLVIPAFNLVFTSWNEEDKITIDLNGFRDNLAVKSYVQETRAEAPKEDKVTIEIIDSADTGGIDVLYAGGNEIIQNSKFDKFVIQDYKYYFAVDSPSATQITAGSNVKFINDTLGDTSSVVSSTNTITTTSTINDTEAQNPNNLEIDSGIYKTSIFNNGKGYLTINGGSYSFAYNTECGISHSGTVGGIIINGGSFTGGQYSVSKSMICIDGSSLTVNGGAFIPNGYDYFLDSKSRPATPHLIKNARFRDANAFYKGQGDLVFDNSTATIYEEVFYHTADVDDEDSTFSIVNDSIINCHGDYSAFINLYPYINEDSIHVEKIILKIDGGSLYANDAEAYPEGQLKAIIMGSPNEDGIVSKSGSLYNAVNTSIHELIADKIYFYGGTIVAYGDLPENYADYYVIPDYYKLVAEEQENEVYNIFLELIHPTGNWNLDDKMDIADIVWYRKYLAGEEEATTKYDKIKNTADLDLNDDEEVDLIDLIAARIELASE